MSGETGGLQPSNYYGKGAGSGDTVALVFLFIAVLGTLFLEIYVVWYNVTTHQYVPLYLYPLKFCVWCFYIGLFAMTFKRSDDGRKMLILIMLLTTLATVVAIWNDLLPTVPLPYTFAPMQAGLYAMVNKVFLGYGVISILLFLPPVSRYVSD